MRHLLMAIVVTGCAAALSVNAQDADGRKGLSEDEATQRQSVIKKYDSDGDGVLSKSEQKNLSKEDKKTLAKTGGVGTAGKPPKQDKKKNAKDSDGGHDHDHDHDADHDHKAKDEPKADKDSKAQKDGGGGNDKGGKK